MISLLMIQHPFKSLKTIKSPAARFIVMIIRGKLFYSNRIFITLAKIVFLWVWWKILMPTSSWCKPSMTVNKWASICIQFLNRLQQLANFKRFRFAFSNMW